MSCFKNYFNAYSNIDNPKALGTFTDDFTGGTACILPHHVINTFSDKGAQDFINGNICEFTSPVTNSTIKLEPTQTGCRMDFSNISREEAVSNLNVISDIYNKDVREKILGIVAERDKYRDAYAYARSNFDSNNDALNVMLKTYYKEIADSNNLVIRRDQLRAEQARVVKELADIRAQVNSAIKEADSYVNKVNSTILKGDKLLSFVAVCEHTDYKGGKQTLKPNAYMYIPPSFTEQEYKHITGGGQPIKNVMGISSIIIPPGMSARIWTNRNYTGTSNMLKHNDRLRKNLTKKTFTENTYNYQGTGFAANVQRHIPYNDYVASIEVQKVKSIGEYMDGGWLKTI